MYLDAFVAAVPVTDKAAYIAFAERIDRLFVEHGALRVVDGWADDVPHGTQTDFYRAVQAKKGEAVVFGYIEWPDKATRMAGFDAAMKDDRMQGDAPFDGKRMIFGGFDAVSIQEK